MTVAAAEEEEEEETQGKHSTQHPRDDREIMQMLKMRGCVPATLCHEGNVKRNYLNTH